MQLAMKPLCQLPFANCQLAKMSNLNIKKKIKPCQEYSKQLR